MTAIYITFVLLIALLAYLSARYATRGQVIAVMAFVALTLGAPWAYFDTLSRCKLLSDEMLRNDDSVKVYGYVAKAGEALYLTLGLQGIPEPRYYCMPWSDEARKLAQQLQDLAGKDGPKGQAMLANPFEPSLEHEKKIYELPPAPMLPKPESDRAPELSA